MADDTRTKRIPAGLLAEDLHYFNEGTHRGLYRFAGAQTGTVEGVAGTRFTVWAPNARAVSVIGDFNGWVKGAAPLRAVGVSGLWTGFISGVGHQARYKYAILPRGGEEWLEKADPVGFFAEVPPRTASVVWAGDYRWGDGRWLKERGERHRVSAPMAVYEVHLGSWRRGPGGRVKTYRELAVELSGYVRRLGFTHVEFLPVMEHPFDGSWGYQTLGYFAPTSRYGSPEDFMYLVDHLHRAGIGVILDWVPAHFPKDPHGLGDFDGTHLYEHADPRLGVHPDWGSYIFNYGRNEVRSFLLSSALFWFDRYHIDGLRVDAVASMLYLDYSRRPGEWIPNRDGSNANLEAIDFLKTLNRMVYEEFPDVVMIAEESTAWPGVTRPVHHGGLGFGLKWDMGWMHDTLRYLSRDPIHRQYHHGEMTFRMDYAFSENYVLPLSHDEVVHGKGSLLQRMPGDSAERRANLRLLYGYQYTLPGKKLLFMGDEWGAAGEWNYRRELDWPALNGPGERGILRLVGDLNRLYRGRTALHQGDAAPEGFQWVERNDWTRSTLAYLRFDQSGNPLVIGINFTPVPRTDYLVWVPKPGRWRRVLNTDARRYGGSGWPHGAAAEVEARPGAGEWGTLTMGLPPLAMVIWEPDDERTERIGGDEPAKPGSD